MHGVVLLGGVAFRTVHAPYQGTPQEVESLRSYFCAPVQACEAKAFIFGRNKKSGHLP